MKQETSKGSRKKREGAEESQEGEEALVFHNKGGLHHSAWEFTENLVSDR